MKPKDFQGLLECVERYLMQVLFELLIPGISGMNWEADIFALFMTAVVISLQKS